MDPEYSEREPQYIGAQSRWSSRHWLLAAAGLALLIAILMAVILAGPANRYPVAMNGRFGYIDHSGKIVIPVQFSDAGLFDEGLAPVSVGKTWGYADRNGKIVIAPTFDIADPFSDGIALVGSRGKYGYIDKTGAFVVRPQYMGA
jgi:hypothetical protein